MKQQRGPCMPLCTRTTWSIHTGTVLGNAQRWVSSDIVIPRVCLTERERRTNGLSNATVTVAFEQTLDWECVLV